MTKVLITDHPFEGLGPEEEVFSPLGIEFALADDQSPERLSELVGEADAILACFAQVPASVIEAAPKCRIISRYGIGFDNVDIAAASAAGIVVTTVPDYCLDEVADHALALLLAYARGVVVSNSDVRSGRWALPERPLHRLRGRTLALVGYGAIGRRVAERAQAFGLELVVYDPYATEAALDGARRADSVATALAEADFISLHAPLTAETRHLIDADALAAANRRPLLINTSRGGLVDTEAVADALAANRLGGAALDVTETEPLDPQHRLLADPRAIVTPHTAYYSAESLAELQRRAAGEVARVLQGEAPENPRNSELLADTTEAGR